MIPAYDRFPRENAIRGDFSLALRERADGVGACSTCGCALGAELVAYVVGRVSTSDGVHCLVCAERMLRGACGFEIPRCDGRERDFATRDTPPAPPPCGPSPGLRARAKARIEQIQAPVPWRVDELTGSPFYGLRPEDQEVLREAFGPPATLVRWSRRALATATSAERTCADLLLALEGSIRGAEGFERAAFEKLHESVARTRRQIQRAREREAAEIACAQVGAELVDDDYTCDD